MQTRAPSDTERLTQMLSRHPEVTFLLFVRPGLDDLLAAAWALHKIREVLGRFPVIHIGRELDHGLPAFADVPRLQRMAADSRSLTDAEQEMLVDIWEAHCIGELHSHAMAVAAGRALASPWMDSLSAAQERFPWGPDGLPGFSRELLLPLKNGQTVETSTVIGTFLSANWGTAHAIDTDGVLYRLIEELALKAGLLLFEDYDPSDYPGASSVRLSPRGADVLGGRTRAALEGVDVLRWWGGKDLLGAPRAGAS